jgi:hypothetical protein
MKGALIMTQSGSWSPYMFLVFAIWAAFGFSYPSTPIPIALNAISKVLCFVAAITLFLPRKENLAEENISR